MKKLIVFLCAMLFLLIFSYSNERAQSATLWEYDAQGNAGIYNWLMDDPTSPPNGGLQMYFGLNDGAHIAGLFDDFLIGLDGANINVTEADDPDFSSVAEFLTYGYSTIPGHLHPVLIKDTYVVDNGVSHQSGGIEWTWTAFGEGTQVDSIQLILEPFEWFQGGGGGDGYTQWLTNISWEVTVFGEFGDTPPGPAPIPEPATGLLLASGLIGLAGFRRKFRK